jgi:pilus assembly protein FimV
MLRKLALAIVTSGMMASSSVYALGMGEMELESSLNQPLTARIHLLSAEDLEDWEIKPSLASQADFDQAGVERSFFLTNLKFEVVRQAGDTYIQVSTKPSVKEPFLNFLVEVDWPNGRLLREYTLLLDPPVFEEQQVEQAPASAPVAAERDDAVAEVNAEVVGSDEPVMAANDAPQAEEPQDNVTQADEAATMVTAPAVEPAQSSSRDEYNVQKNDTLWEVAVRVRPNKNLSAQQTMLAIQDLNPEAFIDNNINRLRKNQVLRVPTEAEITRRSFNRAAVDVRRQNKEYAKYRGQLDATKQKSAARSVAATDGGELKLVAAGQATADKSQGVDGQVAADAGLTKSSEDLSLALENLDKTKRDNAELQTRLKALEEQIGTLQRLVSLKDEQLAAIQAGVAVPETAPEITAPQTTEPVVNADLNFQEPAPSDVVPVPAEPVKPVKKPFVSPYAETPEPEFDLMTEVMENPLYLAGGLGGLVILLLGVRELVNRRKQQTNTDDARDFAASDMAGDADSLNNEFEHDFNDLDLASADLDEHEFDIPQLDDASSSDLPEELDDNADVETTDVIGEAEIYIAYGRLDQARSQLENALLADRNRQDVRMKLLEVLAEQDDSETFAEHFAVINQTGNANQKADANRLASNLTVAPNIDNSFAQQDDADLSMDFEQSEDVSTSSDLDFNLDDFAAKETPATASTKGNDLEFDLDFSIDEDPASDAETLELDAPVLNEDISLSENSLDFDLDENSLEFDAPVLADSVDAADELDLDANDAMDLSFDLDTPATAAVAETDFAELDSQMDELSAELDDLSLDIEPAAEELDLDDLAELDMSLDDSDDLESLALDMDEQPVETDLDFSFEEPVVGEESDSLDFDLETDVAETPALELNDEPESVVESVVASAPADDTEFAELGIDGLDEDLDFLSGTDECQTKLDLARAYIDMDDNDGAQEILKEVLEEGNDNQKQEANKLLAGLA